MLHLRAAQSRASVNAERAHLLMDHQLCPGSHQHPEAGDPTWCSRCAGAIRARLVELDDLLTWIDAEIDGHRGVSSEDPVSGTKGKPSPSPAVDDLDEIARTLQAWEDAYRELRGFPPTPRRDAELRVPGCIRWLTTILDGALKSPLGKDLGQEILRLSVMARRRCQSDPAKRRLPAPCVRCNLKAVVHHAGDGHVGCESCGRLMLLREWDEYVIALQRRPA